MDFFNKTTSLYILKNIPLDTSYNHTWYFSNKSNQWEHFSKPEYRVATLTQSEYQRYDSGSINVKLPMSTLYTSNYMVFVNDNYIDGYGENKKFFYAFITDVEYVNPNTSRIYYEIDYMQTFMFDYELGESFVVREHSRTDNIGDNLIDEPFTNLQYISAQHIIPDIDNFVICVQLTELVTYDLGGVVITPPQRFPNLNCGIADGTYYWFLQPNDKTTIGELLNIISKLGNKVIQVYLIPDFAKPGSIYLDTATNSSIPFEMPTMTIDIPDIPNWHNWTPKNNKMFTSPYTFFEVTDYSGHIGRYYYELFTDNNRQLKLECAFNNGGAMRITPYRYKGETYDFDGSLVINNLPTASITKDSLSVYMQNNGISAGLSTLTSLIPASKGNVNTGTATSSILNFIGNSLQADARPDTAVTSSYNIKMGNVATKTFGILSKQVVLWEAKMIDDYFTMFGYATNEVKIPNRNVRNRFTYTQTDGCVFKKVNLPQKYANKIASIYDKGITFWKPTATIGDYTTNNLPL